MSPLRRLFGRRPVADAAEHVAAVRARLGELREAGWVLPPSLQRDDVVPSWTRLGVIDGEGCAVVDSRGLVTPDLCEVGSSLDWWVGAEDRWYAPARERGVTQRRIEGAPVVETTLRVPGGEVVHRAYGARGPRYPGSDEWTVVEVENRSPVPVVVAWVVRPYTPVALTDARGAAFHPAMAGLPQGPQLVEAYDPVGVLRRPPSRWAFGEGGVDPFAAVEAGEAGSGPLPDDHGTGVDLPQLCSIALLTPVPHTATTRVALFAGFDIGAHPTPSDSLSGDADVGWPDDLAEAASVARGWGTLADRGPRVEVPDPVLAEAVAAARRSLPLSHRLQRWWSDDDSAPPEHVPVVTADVGDEGPSTAVGDRMEILAATSTWGDAVTVDRALARWPEGQQRGGGFGSPEATALALRALAAHAVATGDVGPARAWLPELGGAVEHLGKVARRLSDAVDAAVVAEGLDAASVLLVGLDQADAAARVAADGARVRAGLRGPQTGGIDLDAPSTTPRAVAAAAVAATRVGGDASAVWALLRRASATWTWSDPERWRGDDGLVTARLLEAVGRLLVTDHADGLALAPWLPPEWRGLGWEVHDLPTRWGRLSYAVRWHGDRPAVLWDLGPGTLPVPDEPVVTAPGLSASWSSTERRGEALLDPVPALGEAPEAPAADDAPDAVPGTRGVAIAAPPRSVWRPQDAGPDSPPVADGTPDPGEDPPVDDGGSFS